MSKYNIEFFQDIGAVDVKRGTTLKDAYGKGNSLKSLFGKKKNNSPEAANSNTTPNQVVSAPQGIGIGNLWQFLGIEDLSLKQKQCVYNCGVDLLGCFERCSSDDCRQQDGVSYEQCRYGCIRKGINCSTNCLANIEKNAETNDMDGISRDLLENIENSLAGESSMEANTSNISEPVMTSMSTVTTSVDGDLSYEEMCLKYYDILPNEVKGVYSSLDDYAPYDMRVWPRDGKYGWTISELNKLKRNGYNAPNVIEVSMNHNLYPIKSDKPLLEFNFDRNR